jgi:MoaE-MoaD fusion protein
MRVRVLFFGMLKDLAGRGEESVTLSEGASVGDLIRHYEETVPRFSEIAGSIAMSVNREYASVEMRLKEGDEVACLPPVSGGSTERARVFLVRQQIDTAAVLESIKRPEDGAVVVFEGVVRNHSRGRRTLYLDYEAYEEMGRRQLEGLAAQACAEIQIRDVAIVHRLGRVQIGETSVLIVVASAHRAAAFEACRWLIDALKKTVPIWKKEYFEDGAIWADGEPFPAEIPRAAGTHSQGPASK